MSRAKKDDEENYWMKGAVKRPGALHRNLRIPMDKKIPSRVLEKATHSKSPTIRKEAVLAKTFKNARKG